MTDLSIHLVDREAPAASPFLPGTKLQYAWDSTSLGYLKTCPRLYQYIMIDGWGGKDESIHLRFGIEYHSALEEYDRLIIEGHDRDDVIREVIHNTLIRTVDWDPDPTVKAGKYKNRRTLVQAILGYFDHFVKDEAQTLVLENGSPAVELSFRFELDFGAPMEYNADNRPYILSGHLDRVVEFGGGHYVMDRKTSLTTLGDYYFDQYAPNNQMTLYTLASKVILGAPIKGVIIDAVQIMLENPHRYVRGFTYRTNDQLEEWVTDLSNWLKLAEDYAFRDYWPQNDTACDKFGGCRFRGICSKSPQVREKFLASNYVQQPLEERWNPLRPR